MQQALERSVIRILNAGGTTVGTGFIVGDALAVTCAHVAALALGLPAEGSDQACGKAINVECYWNRERCLALVERDFFSPVERDDAAFLRIAALPADAAALPLASAQHREGQPYAALGFPKQPEAFESRRENGIINGLIQAKGRHDLLQIEGNAVFFGMSGSPILDTTTGKVVGMVSKGLDDKYVRFVYATTSDTLAGLCAELRLDGAAELPAKGILPPYRPLPPGSRMLYPRNENFTGRVPDLLALADCLVYGESSGPVSIAPAAAVSGMGGIGKTQLAVEFCYRYGPYFDGVHWVNAQMGDLDAEIAQCGMLMGLEHFPDGVPDQAARTVYEWQKTPNRLVVLDNLEDPDLLQTWLPKFGAARVLVTSRRERWPGGMGVQVYPLELLPRAESLALLRRLASRLEAAPDADLDTLADYLGDLPLALDLAGRYLDECRSVTVEKYLEELKGKALQHQSLIDWAESSPTRHATSLVATFELSWLQIDGSHREDDAARRIFWAAGYLAPSTTIPPELLFKAINAPLHEKKKQGVVQKLLKLLRKTSKTEIDQPGFDRAVHRLLDLGLLRGSPEAPQIHPLLAEFARRMEDPEQAVLEPLADVLAMVSNQANNTGLPAAFLPIRAHLEAAAGHAERAGLGTAGTLWNNFASQLRMVAEYPRAKFCCERALAIGEKIYGPDHPMVATFVNNLGSVLRDLGDMAGARDCCERALAIGEKVYGPGDPKVALRVNNLGNVLQALGDLAGARDCCERALAIGEKVYGPDHPMVATFVNNLGSVLRDLGDMAGARDCFERALAIDEKVYGPEHPNVATDVNNLGLLLQDLGDLTGAKACCERALAIDEKVYGPEHPQVATKVNNLGWVLRDLGDLTAARACCQRALAIWKKFLPEGHPSIKNSQSWLDIVERELRDGQ